MKEYDELKGIRIMWAVLKIDKKNLFFLKKILKKTWRRSTVL